MKRWLVVGCVAMACSKPDPKPAPTPVVVTAGSDAKTDSAATQLLTAWFTAFNADDFVALHAFHAKHMPALPDDVDENFRTMTGGFVIKRMEQPSPTSAAAIIKEQKSDQFARAILELDPKDPDHISHFDVNATDTPDEFLTPELRAQRTIDGPKRSALIDKVAAALTAHYVDPAKAKTMIAALRAHLAHGDYDKIDQAPAFAIKLTEDLHADTHDLHLRIMYSPPVKRDGPPIKDGPPPKDEQLKQLRQMNFGFGPIERMSGNVAHLVIDGFPDASLDEAQTAIGDLMTQVADADALIIDLRGNGGGSPETVALVASYVFDDKPVHLVDIFSRDTNKTVPSFTHAKVHGTRFGGKKPIYVLTAKRTFSGGEEFAYDLQTTKRAKVVGETTGGGAHPTEGLPLDDSFQIAVPFGASISPITHTNWEGVGVIPDIPTTAEAALDEAHKRALADLKIAPKP
jgi:hypothetical protein